MTKKLRAIIISALYILYLIFILPWYLLFLLILNIIRRRVNSLKLKNTLKNYSLPRNLRKKIAKNYRKNVKVISIKNLRILRRTSKSSKKEDTIND